MGDAARGGYLDGRGGEVGVLEGVGANRRVGERTNVGERVWRETLKLGRYLTSEGWGGGGRGDGERGTEGGKQSPLWNAREHLR